MMEVPIIKKPAQQIIGLVSIQKRLVMKGLIIVLDRKELILIFKLIAVIELTFP